MGRSQVAIVKSKRGSEPRTRTWLMSSAKGLGRLPSLHLVLQRLGGLGQELEAGGAHCLCKPRKESQEENSQCSQAKHEPPASVNMGRGEGEEWESWCRGDCPH